jgi:hypothetical protein
MSTQSKTLEEETGAPVLLQPLADDPVDLAAVGSAFGLSHDGSDYGADGLGVAFAYLLYGVWVVGNRFLDDSLQLS